MNLRIQTYGEFHAYILVENDSIADISIDGVSVYEVLDKGLKDLMDMCDVVEEKFIASRDEFVNKMQE